MNKIIYFRVNRPVEKKHWWSKGFQTVVEVGELLAVRKPDFIADTEFNMHTHYLVADSQGVIWECDEHEVFFPIESSDDKE